MAERQHCRNVEPGFPAILPSWHSALLPYLRSHMEVILREHVDNVGRRGEVVKVADGYARNYLLPRKLALLVTDGNKKQIEREREKFDAKEAEEQKVAQAMAERIGGVEVAIARKVGETD